MERLRLFYTQEGYWTSRLNPRFDYDEKEHWIFIKFLSRKAGITLPRRANQKQSVFPESEIWQELEMLPGMTFPNITFQGREKM